MLPLRSCRIRADMANHRDKRAVADEHVTALTQELRQALPDAMLALVNELTSTMFCVKDAQGRYVAVNPTFVLRTNERSPRQVIGRTAGELFIPALAKRYETQDARVLLTGRPLRNELEMIRPPGGEASWYHTSKVPLRSGDVFVGLVSLSQDLGGDVVDDPAMMSLTRVVRYIEANLGSPIRVAELAAEAGCSVDSLERRVRRVFHRSPGQLVLTARIDRARSLLSSGDDPIVDIASACGFYDQPAFSRTFARLTGGTPAQFRRESRR